MKYDLKFYEKAADYIRSKTDLVPELGIILGTALGAYADLLEDAVSIDFSEIPNFPKATVSGHAGKLILGRLGGKTVACMNGRVHRYEGYSYEKLATPVRVLKLLGIKKLIVTNAAGAINLDYHVGDIMIIKDHIKLFGDSPLRGRNPEELGPRYPDVSDMYPKDMRDLAKVLGSKHGLSMQEGVYFFFPGPQFETPAEIRAARILGGDAAGMSTAPEALTAAHCGIPVLGLSVMVNMAAGILEQPITLEEMDDVTSMLKKPFLDFMAELTEKI